MVALLESDISPVRLLRFATTRGLRCFVAADDPSESSRIGKTQAAFQVQHRPVSIVVDQSGKIRYYGNYVGHVDGAARFIEQTMK